VNLAVHFTDEGYDPRIRARVRDALEKLKPQLSRQELQEAERRSEEWFEVYQES
jgi:hypothetical protein